MEKKLIEEALESALNKLLKADHDLLSMDANERSITHRLAIYLEEHFPGWNVDCEYNRDGYDSKTLEISSEYINSDDLYATTVFPDIIIHHRGTKQNLLAIELKKKESGNYKDRKEYDIKKLNAFKKQLGYQFTVFIAIDSKDWELQWI